MFPMTGPIQQSDIQQLLEEYSKDEPVNGSEENVVVDYPFGAKYIGPIKNGFREGCGEFILGHSRSYQGFFEKNLRSGEGQENYPDGSVYQGSFHKGFRHGKGKLSWPNGESYSGDFCDDHQHGYGIYRFSEESFYEGGFYMNERFGVGQQTISDGKIFSGVYKNNSPFGPGVLSTEMDGKNSVDIGWWDRSNLIRLCIPFKEEMSFTMEKHPEFEYEADEHKELLQVVDANPKIEVLSDLKKPATCIDQKEDFGKTFADVNHNTDDKPVTNTAKILLSASLSQLSLAFDKSRFDEAFFSCLSSAFNLNTSAVLNSKTPSISNSDDVSVHWNEHNEKPYAVNNTPVIIQLQAHALRMVPFLPILKTSEILYKVAQMEQISSEYDENSGSHDAIRFFEASTSGDAKIVRDLLHEKRVHVDVTDNKGRGALLLGTLGCHKSVVNCLLDFGANINILSDEGVSALVAAHIYYYPVSSFRWNLAENKSSYSADQLSLSNQDAGSEHSVNEEQMPSNSTPTNNVPTGTSDTSSAVSTSLTRLLYAEHITPEPVNPGVRSSKRQNLPVINKNDDDDEFDNFSSDNTQRHVGSINLPEKAVETYIKLLSCNSRVISNPSQDESIRVTAIQKAEHQQMKEMIDLLLSRGANPNVSNVPFPPVFFAVKAADVDALRLLLLCKADPNHTLRGQKGRLTPLHISVAVPGEEGVLMSEMLLNALADPNARASTDDSFLITKLKEEWSKDVIQEPTKQLLGGRTSLHIACSRDDNYDEATRIIRLLIEHHADTKLLCNGHSALSLAIISGNDLAIDVLLQHGIDVSLPLSHGMGSALCVALHPDFEYRRTPEKRKALVDKLLRSGADILAPIPIGLKRTIGSVVDYVHHVYNLDKRIAHLPYHALNQMERETYNYRKSMVGYLGDRFREAAIKREHDRLLQQLADGQGKSPSDKFVYTGTGRKPVKGDLRVTFADALQTERKPVLKYCYNCGRMVGVRLSPCTRCKEVYFCSKACKVSSWNSRHKEECIRISGQEKTGGHRADSPTPVTYGSKSAKATVHNLSMNPRVKVPIKGRSVSAGKSRDTNKANTLVDNELLDNYSFI